jgi:hypothetical protein
MTRFASLAAATIALGSVVGAGAQSLWNGAAAGMTPAQVRDAVPAAGGGQLIDRGADQVLRVNNLRAGGHDAFALFDFDSAGLRSVELRLAPEAPQTAVDPQEVQSQLTGKYGPPAACDDQGDHCEWRDGATRITLLGPRSSDDAGVAIVYRPAAEGESAGAQEAATPLTVVRAFYADLTRGDGAAAAALVVPQKRGQGHLSAQALTSFYGALPGPIHLTDASPRSDDDVLVHYQFVAGRGRLCDGSADVRTTRAGDQVLIDAIRAWRGC